MKASKKLLLFIASAILILISISYAHAGDFAFTTYAGYGILKYEEKEDFLGKDYETKFKQNAIMFGFTGEYLFHRPKNFFLAGVTEFEFGLENEEKSKENNVQFRTNDVRSFSQFYDIVFGYKNTHDTFHYKLYTVGGWDGLHFEKEKVISSGSTVPDSGNEDIKLWRTGVGTNIGFTVSDWVFDGRFTYFYYPDGKTENSAISQRTFDTNGYCLDMSLGASRNVAKNLWLYLGGSYTMQKLKDDAESISWKSKFEILAGVASLTYAF